jgi:hypothetical protein
MCSPVSLCMGEMSLTKEEKWNTEKGRHLPEVTQQITLAEFLLP